MNGKLKALGLALVTAVVLSAVGVSGASAAGEEEFHSAVTHTIYDAEKIGNQVFDTTAGIIQCKNVSVNSATTNTSTSKELTATPVYTACEDLETGLVVHVRMRTCDYLFTSKKVGNHAPVHIKCSSPGDEIRVNLTFLGAEVACLDVPAQTPTGGGVVYVNVNKGSGTGHVNVIATVAGIEYTELGICDPDGGAPNVANDGIYEGEVTVKGTDTSGNIKEIYWT